MKKPLLITVFFSLFFFSLSSYAQTVSYLGNTIQYQQVSGTYIWNISASAVSAWSLDDGEYNSTQILSSNPSSTAACKVCDNLNTGGVTGWYLPSAGELQKIVQNGSFSGNFWSSTELYPPSSSGPTPTHAFAVSSSGNFTSYVKTGLQGSFNVICAKKTGSTNYTLPEVTYSGSIIQLYPLDNAVRNLSSTYNNVCSNLTAFGYSDWRLPTYSELVAVHATYPLNSPINNISTPTTSAVVTRWWVNSSLPILYVSPSGSTNNTTANVIDFARCRCVRDKTSTGGGNLVLNITPTNPSCNSGSDGLANVSVTGGSGNYIYSWSNGSNSPNISNLSAGQYTVTVTDLNLNINASQSITLTAPSALTLNATQTTQESTAGANDGVATVTVSGGTSPYSYLWSSGSNNQSAAGLGGGSYTVTVTDDNGCMDTDNVTISTGSSGGGGSSGNTIYSTLSGGNWFDTLSWIGNTIPNSNNDVIIQGSITLSYGLGYCNNLTINNNGTLRHDAYRYNVGYAKNITVGGDLINNGTIEFEVWRFASNLSYPDTEDTLFIDGNFHNNGTTYIYGRNVSQFYSNGMSYSSFTNSIGGYISVGGNIIQNEVTFHLSKIILSSQSTQNISTQASGNLRPIYTDNANTIINITSNFSSVTIYGPSNGQVAINLNGHTPDGTINNAVLSNASTIHANLNNVTINETILNIANNTTWTDVDVTATTMYVDGSNNWTNVDLNVNNTQIELGASLSYNNDNHIGRIINYGSFGLGGSSLIDGDVLNYSSMSVAGGAIKKSLINQGTVSGNGQLDIEEDIIVGGNINCTVKMTGVNTQYLMFPYSQTSSSNNYKISTLLLPNDISGLFPQWKLNGQNINGATTNTLTLNNFGYNNSSSPYATYQCFTQGGTSREFHIIDGSMVLYNNDLYVGIEAFDDGCNGVSGEINLQAIGGSPNYSYNWGNLSGNNPTNLSAGTYYVTVTDQSNNSVNTGIAINSNISVNTTDVLCHGGNNGTASISLSNGFTGYSTNWNGQSPNALSAGNYTVTVSNNGCSASESFTISEPVAPTVSVSSSDVSCFGNSDGNASINITPNNPNQLFSDTQQIPFGTNGGNMSFALNTGSLNQSLTLTIEGTGDLSATNEYLTLYDENNNFIQSGIFQYGAANCSLNSTTITLSASDVTNWSSDGVINFTLDPYYYVYGNNSSSCNSFTLSVSVPDPWMSPNYSWSNGQSTANVNNLSTGNYSVTATNYNGCTVTQTTIINSNPQINLNGVVTPVSCNGGSDGSIQLNTSGGSGSYSTVWSNNVNPNALSVGTYTVTVTDGNGCAETQTFSVSEPSNLNISTLSATNVSCFGGNDGTAQIAINGGNGSYITTWSGNANPNSLSSGSYTVSVTDANGCTATQNINITEPSPINIQATITNVQCKGDSDGSIAINLSGGIPNYTTSWSNGGSPTNLSAGTYTVSVTDANGCFATSNFTVLEPLNDLTLSTTVLSNVDCYGNNNGSVSINVVGGTYNYNWGNQTPNALTSGTYTVTALNNFGCTLSDTFIITEPTQLINTLQTQNITCNGFGDGLAIANTSGGTSPYSYDWGNISDTSAIQAGNYTMTITDINGCVLTETFTITEPNPIYVQNSVTDILCHGDSSGTIVIGAISGGTPNYSYNWNNTILTNLVAGDYPLLVTDANGCIYQDTLTVNQPSILTSTTTVVQNVSCNGGNDGIGNSIAQGGVGSYTYNWNNANPNSLSAGIYLVNISDNNQCSITDTIVVTEPTVLSSTLNTTDILCYGDTTGDVSAIINGGVGTYQLAWNTPDTTAIPAGNYQLTVTDGNNCTLVTPFSINQPTALNFSLTAIDETCNNLDDGTVTANISGGVGGYNFNWNNIDTTSLEAGTYNVTVNDANNCIITDSFVINQPPPITTTTNSISPICFGGSNGSVSVNASGGVGSLITSWSNGTTGLSAGNYIVTVTDITGCQITDTATVIDPMPITVGYTLTDASCFGSSDGTASFTFTGGTAPYNIALEAGVNPNALSADDYLITVTDINNCTITDTFTISSPNDVTVSVILVDATSSNAQDGSISLIVNGDYPPFTYSWSNGATTSSISNLNPNDYTVEITDATGCKFNRTYTVDNLTNTDLKEVIEYAKLFPNPTSNYINLEVLFKTYSEANISIMDMNGRILNEQNVEGTYIKHYFDLESFSDGLYIIKIATDLGVSYKKFIITK